MYKENLIVVALVILIITLYLANYKKREEFSSLKRRVMGYANLTDGSTESVITEPRHQKVAYYIAKKVIQNINIESNENYHITNFDQISVNEYSSVGGKPAIKYTLDLFVAKPHVGVNGPTKHLIIVFYIVEADNPTKAGSNLSYSDDNIYEIKAQVESVTLANAEPYPTKLFFDETNMKQDGDNIIIDDSLIKSNNNIIMGVNESSIPFGLFKSCKMSKDSKENGGPVDCDKQFNLQEKIFPAQIQERQELNGLINNVMHENQHARFLHYENANKFGKCQGIATDLSNHTILGEPTENSWLFEKSRDRISRSHGTTI
jgi:hypothetical protein